MIEKTASVHWEDPGRTGHGQTSTETGALERTLMAMPADSRAPAEARTKLELAIA